MLCHLAWEHLYQHVSSRDKTYTQVLKDRGRALQRITAAGEWMVCVTKDSMSSKGETLRSLIPPHTRRTITAPSRDATERRQYLDSFNHNIPDLMAGGNFSFVDFGISRNGAFLHFAPGFLATGSQ